MSSDPNQLISFNEIYMKLSWVNPTSVNLSFLGHLQILLYFRSNQCLQNGMELFLHKNIHTNLKLHVILEAQPNYPSMLVN